MTTVHNYSELLEAMIGIQGTNQPVRWVLDGEFDADIGKILKKKMQNLEVSVKTTVTVPPVQSAPVQSSPAVVIPAVQPPADVPVVQSSAVSSSAVEDPFEWTKYVLVSKVEDFLSKNSGFWLKRGLTWDFDATKTQKATISDAYALVYTVIENGDTFYYYVAPTTRQLASRKDNNFILIKSKVLLKNLNQDDETTKLFNSWKTTKLGHYIIEEA